MNGVGGAEDVSSARRRLVDSPPDGRGHLCLRAEWEQVPAINIADDARPAAQMSLHGGDVHALGLNRMEPVEAHV